MRNRRASSDTAASMTPEAWSGVSTEWCDEAITEIVRSNHVQNLFILSVLYRQGYRFSTSNGSIPSFLGTLFHSSVAPLRSTPDKSDNRTSLTMSALSNPF